MSTVVVEYEERIQLARNVSVVNASVKGFNPTNSLIRK